MHTENRPCSLTACAVPLRLVEKVRYQHPPHPSHDRAPLLQRQGGQRSVVAAPELDAVYRVRHLRNIPATATVVVGCRGGRFNGCLPRTLARPGAIKPTGMMHMPLPTKPPTTSAGNTTTSTPKWVHNETKKRPKKYARAASEGDTATAGGSAQHTAKGTRFVPGAFRATLPG